MESPVLFKGQHFSNDRGGISFVNDFTFKDVIRFYMLHGRISSPARDWHGHRTEFKYVMAVHGKALVAAIPIEDWDNPRKDAQAFCQELSVFEPAVLYIPPGYANSFKALTEDATLMFFSNLTVAQSKADDYRWPAEYWEPWGRA